MQLVLLLVLLVLVGCGGEAVREAAGGPERWPVHREAAAGVAVPVPPGWRVAGTSLTPALVDPVEVISLGTAALRPPRRGSCAHMPEGAVRALGARDVLVSLQERASGRPFPPRRRPFRLRRARHGDAAACAGRLGELVEHRVAFGDAGRAFYAIVVLGRDVPAARRREVRQVLDGLVVEPRPGRPFVLPTAGVRGRLPGGWRLVQHRLTGAVAWRHQIAAGTFAVPPGPPDRNCAPSPALDRLPPDGAFVFAFEYDDPGPRLLRRSPPRPERFRLPTRAQGYECFGPSRLLRWRERGRAFQAHVTLGPSAPARRRTEALRFLDALQVARR